ncbi:hypothetical protein [Marinospirillum sp.]|uniref:hypothetical protein n=1 Tax=Marinospirillum sp. TaxID=2183934 RepID=UPI00384F2E85
MSMEKKKNEKGFILPLALLMMLFVGVVVITSSERTGQETRQAQSQAPTATLQAAAEAGLLTLRQKINEAGQKPDGICKDDTENTKEFCECLVENNDEIKSTRLAEIMGDKGFPENEKLFSSKEGLPDTYWWFESGATFLACFEGTTNQICQDEDLIPKDKEGNEIADACSIVADVFVGDPALEPGSFMTGTINIQNKSNDVDNLFDLGGSKKFEDLTADDLEDIYEDDYFETIDTDVFAAQKVASGSSLDPGSLDSDKINLLVLEGDLSIDMSQSYADKQVIIVSKNSDDVYFGAGNTGKGSGNNSDGKKTLEGWIIAPNATMQMGTGVPKLDVNVNVDSCKSEKNGRTVDCFKSQGGSGFDNEFGSGNFKEPESDDDSDDESTGKVKVDKSEEMDMDFDY